MWYCPKFVKSLTSFFYDKKIKNKMSTKIIICYYLGLLIDICSRSHINNRMCYGQTITATKLVNGEYICNIVDKKQIRVL